MDFIPRNTIARFLDSDLFHPALLAALSIAWAFRGSGLEGGYCHIHKFVLSSAPDLHFHVHQLWSTFTQLAVRTLWTSSYILLHSVPCTFDTSVLVLLLRFDHTCVRLQTQLCNIYSSISASNLICTLDSIYKLVDTPCSTSVWILTKITPLCCCLSLWLYSDLWPLTLCLL